MNFRRQGKNNSPNINAAAALFETGEFIGHVHLPVDIRGQEFGPGSDLLLPGLVSDVVEENGAHAPGHDAAGHQQQFDSRRRFAHLHEAQGA